VIVCLLLAILGMLAYANSVTNGFAFDDVAVVQFSDRVQHLEWTLIWHSNYWDSKGGPQIDALYRPLTLWTYLASQAMAPGAAWPHHVGNVLLHGLVTVMGTLLAWRIFGSRGVAILTGLIFAVHPLHTEVVANIVGRAELLSTVFMLAAFLVYLPDAHMCMECKPTRRPFWHGGLVAACFFLAMLSKETPIALLGGFVGIDLWRWMQWGRTEGEGRPALMRWMGRQMVRYYLPLGVALGVYLAMRINACGLMRDLNSVHPLVNPLSQASVAERLITPFALFAKYLALTFWPAVLSADYSFPSIMPVSNPLAAMPLIGIMVTVLAWVACVKTWRKSPEVALTIGLFACSYALVSNYLRIGTILGERLFYLPSLFVLMLVAAVGMKLYGEMAKARRPVLVRWASVGIVVVACVAMYWRTMVRNTDWADNIPLAIATARDNPMSAKACFWAGSILAAQGGTEKMTSFGAELLKRATELYPNYGLAPFELAKYEARKQHLAKSLIYMAQAAQFNPGNDLRSALTEVKVDLRRAEPDQYMPELLENEKSNPDSPAAQLALGIAFTAQGKYDLADEAYLKALTLSGKSGILFHEAACELSLLRLKTRNQEEDAIETLRKYVLRVGFTVEARCMLASELLNVDSEKFPGALAEAKYWLNEADAVQSGSSQVRELRSKLGRKMAEAHLHMEATKVSMATHEEARSQ